MSYRDYLLPFYLTATVCDKIKEMSGARDRDYHETITESPLSNRSEPQHVSLSMNANTISVRILRSTTELSTKTAMYVCRVEEIECLRMR